MKSTLKPKDILYIDNVLYNSDHFSNIYIYIIDSKNLAVLLTQIQGTECVDMVVNFNTIKAYQTDWYWDLEKVNRGGNITRTIDKHFFLNLLFKARVVNHIIK
jgi:hypothetical protein